MTLNPSADSNRAAPLGEKDSPPARLVEQCQAGQAEAFGLLVEQFEKRIFNFLYQLAGNSHDAEDLTQETFVKAFQSIHRFDLTRGFSTWLFTIAKRTAYNHFRGVRKFEELDPEAEIDRQDPSVLLQEKDEKHSLWKLAATLKPDQYEALWLRYSEGFSVAEIARILNTNQIRVRVLLHRGRKEMAKSLNSSQKPK